jgi:hypothetical protein
MTGYVCAGEYLDDKIGTIKASVAASYNVGTGYYDPAILAGCELFIEAKDKFLMGAGDEETANPANGTLEGSDTTFEETTGNENATQPHTVNDAGHTHTLVPPNIRAFYIIRVDNSYLIFFVVLFSPYFQSTSQPEQITPRDAAVAHRKLCPAEAKFIARL